MSINSKKHVDQKLEEVGKLLVSRLHEAKEKKGYLLCPRCQTIFDGTHLIKCPECRTLISNAFEEAHAPGNSRKRKMELDFFT